MQWSRNIRWISAKLVINLKTANALGVKIPNPILAQATKVIEQKRERPLRRERPLDRGPSPYHNWMQMNALASITVASPVNRAYAAIRESILSLQYAPKQALRAQELSDELMLSRTPVREALARLEQEGLVLRESGWGYVVRDFTLTEAMNLYKVREALEVEAINEAIGKVDDSVIALLTEILDHAEAALEQNRRNEFLARCRRFHELIAHTTANSILEDMIETISGQVRLVSALVIRKRGERAADVLRENRRILQALKKKDREAAIGAVRHHIKLAGENLFVYFTRIVSQQH